MKKQDNESLIQELTKRLDWYLTEASEEEFDAEEVQTLMKLLDSLKTDQDDDINDEFPVEEALSDFWKYCEEREEDERILAAAEEEERKGQIFEKRTKQEKEVKAHKILRFFHRHKVGTVAAAAVLIVILLGSSWQVVANAEKHGGFFWWMDKNEEGTTMITSPDGLDERNGNKVAEYYYKINDVPEEYRKYAEIPLEIPEIREYKLKEIKIVVRETASALHVFLQGENNIIVHFQIVIYPDEILRIREGYPGYDFIGEFENNGIKYEVFEKDEKDGKQNYIVYFYYDNVKYAMTGIEDENLMKEIAKECGTVVAENNSKK